MPTNPCDHLYVRTGEQHRTKPMRGYSKYWDVYFCQKCLKQQYVLVKSTTDYATRHHDGSERVDELGTS